jgi:hypothetical protein
LTVQGLSPCQILSLVGCSLPSTGITRLLRYLRASPPPQTAQPDSHESPVDPAAITAGASRVASGPRCLHAVANTPAGPMILFAHTVHRRRPSPSERRVGSCVTLFEACSAFTRVTACMLTKSPCDPLHRRLQRLCYLHRCSDCYRAERTSSRAGLAPTVDQRLFAAHFRFKVN